MRARTYQSASAVPRSQAGVKGVGGDRTETVPEMDRSGARREGDRIVCPPARMGLPRERFVWVRQPDMAAAHDHRRRGR